MASLNPWMYHSKSRSKSPGARSRDRSRSRDGRKSPKPSHRSSKYYDDPELVEDDPVPSRRDKPSKYYDDESADEDVYRRLAKTKHPPGHYYVSDEEELYTSAAQKASSALRRTKSNASRPSKSASTSYALEKPLYDSERERDRRYSSRTLKPEGHKSSRRRKYVDAVVDDEESDLSEDPEDDEILAYSAKDYYGYPPSQRHRSRSRGRTAKPAEKLYYVEDDSDELAAAAAEYQRNRSRSASRSRRREEAPKARSTYDEAILKAASTARNQAEFEKYLRQIRNLESEARARSQSRSRNRSKSMSTAPPPAPELDEDWAAIAPIPDCERDDFVPPGQEPEPVPVSVKPATTSKYSFPRIPGLGGLFTGGGSTSQEHPQAPTPPTPGREQEQIPPPPPPAGVHYPAVPRSQYAQHHYAEMQQVPVSGYERPTSSHSRASTSASGKGSRQYANPPQYQYAQLNPDLKYTATPAKAPAQHVTHVDTKRHSKAAADAMQYLEVRPSLRRTSAGRPHSFSYSSPSTEHLNVPGSFPDPLPPPGSAQVDPYSGMRRSSSKARKATAAEKEREKLDKWMQLNRKTGSLESMASSKPPLEVMYDPRPDAKSLKSALASVQTRVESKPLIEILPYLTSNEMAALRAEYRNVMRVNGRSLNLAKHLAARVSGSFGKACHATALGRWDSEAYWIVLYRANPQRRDILIETLIGRPNSEIEKIKTSYRENYGESLEKTIKSEVKPDKFRLAISLALSESRQSDNAPLDQGLIGEDVRALRRALAEGTEMDVLQIVLLRGNAHLREVLHIYKNVFKENFARQMARKFPNVMGEILIHIVNGALNRSVRDAILLHQAIAETEPGRDRAELLISRLVRLHWDPVHLENVKDESIRRYGRDVETAIEQNILAPNAANGPEKSSGGGRNTDWVEFCIELVKSSAYHTSPDNDGGGS